MKKVGIRQARDEFSEVVRSAQREPVVIMSHGHVAAVITGASSLDLEDLEWTADRDLMEQVAESQARGSYISHEEMGRRIKRRLGRR